MHIKHGSRQLEGNFKENLKKIKGSKETSRKLSLICKKAMGTIKLCCEKK